MIDESDTDPGDVDDPKSYSSQVQPLIDIVMHVAESARVRCPCQLPGKGALQMSWLTCSWLLKGPDASHLYTQYLLYVQGRLLLSLRLAYNAAVR